MKKIVWIPALCFLVFLIPLGGWLMIYLPVHHESPRVIGAGRDASGNVRQIVFEGSYRTTGWLPDPEGGHETKIYYRSFFLEESGKPRRQMNFLRDVLPDAVIGPGLCRPVADSSLWIAAGYFEPGSGISVVVFDETHVLYNRKIDVNSDLYNTGHDFWFENGNRRLLYRSSAGHDSYDVMTDTTTAAAK